jgi:hypothetical protein
MPTSDAKTMSTTRNIVVEAAVGTALVLGAIAAVGTSQLGLGIFRPHPIWLVVLVVAARYGAAGFLVAATLGWGALASAGLFLGWAPGVVTQSLGSPTELGALSAAVLVGWVAASRERRVHAMEAKLAAADHRSAADSAALKELRQAALALRARNDRLDLSLTFLRDVAGRLEGSDSERAADAALDLVIARLGARAAAVLVMPEDDSSGRDTARDLVAFMARGLWRPGENGPDATTAETWRTRRPVRAVDLPNGGPSDSDLAAPIVDRSGRVRGVLAARGMARGGASVSALRDLAIVAEWFGRTYSTRVGAVGDGPEDLAGASAETTAPHPLDA